LSTKKILKIAGLNIVIIVLNVILFSPGFIGIQMGGEDVLSAAIGGTAIFISLAVFFYGNWKLLVQKGKAIQTRDINNLDDCVLALKQSYGKRTFDGSITTILDQIDTLRKKKERIRDFLLQKFRVVDAGFEKFNETLSDVEYVFYTNIKGVLNKINAFDEEEYEKIKSNDGSVRLSPKYIASKQSIYNEYITFVKNALDVNEEILLKLDALLLELSSFDSFDASEIENMKEIKDMDQLIKKSKLYY
jgi:hypothetical protein